MGGSSSREWNYDEQLMLDTENQLHEVPDSLEDGFSSVFRSPKYPDGFELPEEQIEGETVRMDTVWKLFESACNRYPGNNCMAFRPHVGDNERGDFAEITYSDVKETCELIGRGLTAYGLQQHERVGLYAKNRAEWMQVHLANQRQGFQTVALYDTLGEEAVGYILEHAEIKVAFCEIGAVRNIIKAKSADSFNGVLEIVYVFDAQEVFQNAPEVISDEDRAAGADVGIKIVGMSELIEAGREAPEVPIAKVDCRDVCFLMYTSGTTGTPKGVQLSNEGFCVVTYAVDTLTPFQDTDRHVSFLPLAHIFECLVETVLFAKGGCVYYFNGNIKLLTNDWISVQPTVIIGVPRVYGKLYDRVMAKAAASSCIKKSLFNMAWNTSSVKTRSGERSSRWDSRLWGDISAQVGFGEVRILLSGAAPLPPYLAEFLRVICMNGFVGQGYGLTETTGGSFVTDPLDLNLGHVGIPLPGVDFRLEDIPDMNYMTTDENPRGEILVKGPPIMLGYLKNQKKTDETIVDGWLHTGDVGRINPNGTLSIIDRKKNLFKTAFGEYIAVERVESAYGKAAAASQIWVYGNSFKSFVVAVVVPDALWAKNCLMGKSLWPDDGADEPAPTTPEFSEKFMAVCGENMEELKKAILKNMKEQEGELKRFERVKDIILELCLDDLLQGFNVENGTLTPSFKLKRPALLRKYVDDLKICYTENGEAPKDDEHWIKN